VISRDKLLEYVNISPGAAWFASGDLPAIQENDLILVGEPGVGGNGIVISPALPFSVSAASPNRAGTWAFLKKLYGYDYQSGIFRSGRAIRMDAMEAREKIKSCKGFSLDIQPGIWYNAVC
jgi:hypothetical protein